MVAAKDENEIHATHGRWTLERDFSGRVIEYVGHFPKNDPEAQAHAEGTARFFAHRNFTHRHSIPAPDADKAYVGEYRKPEDAGTEWRVRLKLSRHDSIIGFESWALQHHSRLLPAARRRQLDCREKRPARASRSGDPVLAFAPMATGLAENLIRALNWEGSPGPAGGVVTVLREPEQAFQVGLYLKNRRYIEPATFWRLNDELRCSPQGEWRIAIAHAETARFMDTFPETGEIKPLLDEALADIVRQRSHKHFRELRTR